MGGIEIPVGLANKYALMQNLEFPAVKTTVLIDPPRKGCDEPFLKQLLAFAPARIVSIPD